MPVGSMLRQARPDLVTVHFTHTPFADTPVLGMLPEAVVGELLDAMAGFDTCGFHTAPVGRRIPGLPGKAGQAGLDGRPPPTFVSPLGTDPDVLTAELDDPAVAEGRRQLDEELGDPGRQVILRVDRMELSKNLLRGFWAFDELLEFEPHRRGRVTFLALAYPSRQGLDEYLSYQRDVEETVARVNARWGTPDWTPILLQVGDDYPRSLAALTRYDVLLVNPVRDGMNLVAKEGPMVNQRDGALVLSRRPAPTPSWPRGRWPSTHSTWGRRRPRSPRRSISPPVNGRPWPPPCGRSSWPAGRPTGSTSSCWRRSSVRRR